MSSEVQQLSDAEIDAALDAAEAEQSCDDYSKARAIEQAVRAQWAAEASQLEESRIRLLLRIDSLATERDSAQAEAKRLRVLLAAVLDLVPLREEFHYLDRGIGTKTASGVTLLSARAALQPGDNQAPRAGETA